MSFSEEEKKKALQLFDETGSISKVIQKLGYPSIQNMYTWIKNRNIERKRRKSDYTDSSDHRRHPSLETKLDIIHRCFEEGEEIKHQDSPHSALNGRTPREVFDSDAAFTPLVHVSKEDLDKAFLQTCKIKGSKDGTVSLHGRKYEVGNLLLRGFRVLVSYRPDTLQVVSVSCPGFQDTTARPVVIGENIDYEARGKKRQRVLEMKTAQGKPKEGSRMLDACMTEYGKRHPDADLCVTAVEECEEVRHT